MKQFPVLVILSVLTLLTQPILAQENKAAIPEKQTKPVGPGKNILKTNLTGIVLRNYDIQFERMLTKKISLGLSYRWMPEGPLPLQRTIINNLSDPGNTELINQIESFRVGNNAITPEVRFYTGKKGYGHGFYFSLFYRHAKHKVGNVSLEYEDSPGNFSTLSLSGDLTSNTIGFMLGSQWIIGKRVALDWWIIGPHAGKGNGRLAGVSSTPLSTSEQAELKAELEDLFAEIPLVESTVTVTANGANALISGPWGGIRAGLSLGIRF